MGTEGRVSAGLVFIAVLAVVWRHRLEPSRPVTAIQRVIHIHSASTVSLPRSSLMRR